MPNGSTESHLGQQPAGLPTVIALCAYFICVGALILYCLTALWPQSLSSGSSSANAQGPSTTTQAQTGSRRANQNTQNRAQNGAATTNDLLPPITIFGRERVFSVQQRLLLLVILAGALGGLLHAVRSFYWYVGNRALVQSWVLMYVFLPAAGAGVAVVFYVVLVAGLFSAQGVGNANPLGLVAVAVLAGLFSQQAMLKLQDVAETIFTKPQPGKNAVPQGTSAKQPGPQIASIAPARPVAGNQTLTVTGSNFDPSLTVTLRNPQGQDVPIAAASVSAVTASSFKLDAQLTSGGWTIIVTNPSGARSMPFAFTV